MPERLKESDKQYPAMDKLANSIAILSNPTIAEVKIVQQLLINETKKE
jgi:hypothetical protein